MATMPDPREMIAAATGWHASDQGPAIAGPKQAAEPGAASEQPKAAEATGSAEPTAAEIEQERTWERVRAARIVKRPHTLDLVKAMATDVLELHGDRLFADDPAIVIGFARFPGHRFVFVGHQKGSEVEENVRRNFGMAHPEGYRKAMRAFALAERFHLPVVTFVDTPGAHPDAASEERGVAESIARAIALSMGLKTPIVSVITGEGGSGGALAIATGDVVLAVENAIYSVISPEGCATILYRDAAAARRAAAAMRLTAPEQLELGVVDEVIPEPPGGAQEDPVTMARAIRERVSAHLDRLCALSTDELLALRYRRYRSLGAFTSVERPVPPTLRKPDLADRLRGIVEAGIEAGRAAVGEVGRVTLGGGDGAGPRAEGTGRAGATTTSPAPKPERADNQPLPKGGGGGGPDDSAGSARAGTGGTTEGQGG
jgi:acetyl-CoA carboxylase carboxyl transferase subunit alpha